MPTMSVFLDVQRFKIDQDHYVPLLPNLHLLQGIGQTKLPQLILGQLLRKQGRIQVKTLEIGKNWTTQTLGGCLKLAGMTELLPNGWVQLLPTKLKDNSEWLCQSAMFHSTGMGCLALLYQASRRFAYCNCNSTPLREKNTARMAHGWSFNSCKPVAQCHCGRTVRSSHVQLSKKAREVVAIFTTIRYVCHSGAVLLGWCFWTSHDKRCFRMITSTW